MANAILNFHFDYRHPSLISFMHRLMGCGRKETVTISCLIIFGQTRDNLNWQHKSNYEVGVVREGFKKKQKQHDLKMFNILKFIPFN